MSKKNKKKAKQNNNMDWKEKLAEDAKEKLKYDEVSQNESAVEVAAMIEIKQIGDIFNPAQAPYNFVPLNEKVIESEEKPGQNNCSFDKFHLGKNTGFIEITIETKTPLYIRDTLTQDEIVESDKAEKSGKKFINPDFFSPAGEIRIPGSSLRGMVRNLVEIMSYGKFRFFEKDKRFYYRSFMDKSSRLKEAYNNKMVAGNGDNGYSQKIKAGYLIKDNMDYKIKLAEIDINGCQYYRVEEDDIINHGILTSRMSRVIKGIRDKNPAYEIWFKKVKFTVSPPKIHKYSVNLYFSKVIEICNINGTLNGSKEGTLVHSGWVGNQRIGKHLHWVIGPKSNNEISITKEVVRDYKNDKNRDPDINLIKWLEKPGVTEVPCFYIEEAENVKSFGHTGLFRLTYDKEVADFVYNWGEHKKDLCDIPTAIFGTEMDFSGRVFFEDAELVLKNSQTKENIFLEIRQPRILSTPKPTTFNHYLCQPEMPTPVFKDIRGNDFSILLQDLTQPEAEILNKTYKLIPRNNSNIYRPNNAVSNEYKTEVFKILVKKNATRHIREFKDIKDWNSDDCIRGNKLYWHRNGNNWIDLEVQNHAQNDDQHTMIKPIKVGVSFTGRIRFENLSEVELGALLFALDLPEDCCHKIGMGKPLGLGSVKIMPKLYLSKREKRYTDLLSEWGSEGETRIQESTNKSETKDDFKDKFQKFVLNKLGENTISDLWAVNRMKELIRMLDFNNKPVDAKTEYMALNKFKERRILPKPTDVI